MVGFHTPDPNLYMNSNTPGAPGVYDDLEGHIFGIPPYITQNQDHGEYGFGQQGGPGGQMDMSGGNMMAGMEQSLGFQGMTGGQGADGMGFAWNGGVVQDPRYRPQ